MQHFIWKYRFWGLLENTGDTEILNPCSHRATELSTIFAFQFTTVPTDPLSQILTSFIYIICLISADIWVCDLFLKILIHLTHICVQVHMHTKFMLSHLVFNKMKQVTHQEMYILSIFNLLFLKFWGIKLIFKKVKISFLCKVLKILKIILHYLLVGLLFLNLFID